MDEHPRPINAPRHDAESGPVQYEIRVARQLGPGMAVHFPEFEVTEDGDCTVMHGSLPDQAALHGVLARIRDLGLRLLAVIQIPADRR